MTRGQNGDEIWSARFSPNGKLLVVGCHRGVLKVINTETQEEERVIEGHLGWVSSIAFSPRGDLAATGSYEGAIKVWNPATWELVQTLSEYSREVKTPFAGICFNQQHPDSPGEIRSLCFSPDGRLLAGAMSYGDDKEKGIKIGIWDPVRGKHVQEIRSGWDPAKAWRTVNALSFAKDGLLGISCSAHVVMSKNWRSTTYKSAPFNVVFDVATGKEIKTFMGDGREDLTAAFSPDGKTFVCGAQGGVINVWDSKNGSQTKQLTRHSDSVDVLTFCSGGKLLVSGGWDKAMRVWDLAVGEQIAWLPCTDRIIAIWSDPMTPHLIVADGGGPSNVPNIDWLDLVGFTSSVSSEARGKIGWWHRLRRRWKSV